MPPIRADTRDLVAADETADMPASSQIGLDNQGLGAARQ
jgi:hypothetical protein